MFKPLAKPTTICSKPITSICIGLALFAGCLLLTSAARAQLVNLLYFPLTNAPGTVTTTFPSSTSLGGANVTLTCYNSAGASGKDLEGLAGSGVNGAATGVAAMCLTNGETGTATGSANNSGAANCAADKADAKLAFGTINNFIVSFWYNEGVSLSDAPGLTLPRLFNLNAAGGNDDTANSIAVKFQLGNQYEFEVNNATTTTGNSYNAPANTASMGTVFNPTPPANKWEFFAVVYDGTNLYQFTGSDSQVSTLAQTYNAPGLTVNLGATPYLFIGDRGVGGTRGLFGWMEDFRLYTNGPATLGANATVVENIRKAIAPHVPSITGIYPDGSRLFQATNIFVFTAASQSSANLTNVSLVLNGVNVSSQLQFVTNGTAGTSTNFSVSFTGLSTNIAANTAVMTAADGFGLVATVTATFDTFQTNNFIVEAEEFDYMNGTFIDNPSYTDGSTTNEANSYYQLDSVEGIDTHKGASTGGNVNDYRYDPGTGVRPQTPVATGEAAWYKFDNLVDTNGTPIVGHMIGNWSSAEWQNYTKTFPTGKYNVYGRLSTSSASTISFEELLSGRGTATQITTNLGNFTFSGGSLASFQWVPLRDSLVGQLAIVDLTGTNTVRLTTGGGANADFFMLAIANTNLPQIVSCYPNAQFLFETTNTLAFTVTSPISTINTANIHVTLNGTNVSSSLVFSGGPSTWNVTYAGLAINQTYNATISVTDNAGGAGGGSFTFDTWNPLYQLEAEDFDFDPTQSAVYDGTGNRFIDNSVPTPPGVNAANSYENQIGVQGIDEQGVTAGISSANYRPSDPVATSRVTDIPRQQFVAAGAFDYNVGFLGPGFWQNYTRTWPAGTYNVYARLASGANLGTLNASWSEVLFGAGSNNQLTRHLGSFSIPSTGGYSSYLYSPLIDRFGNYAQLTLNGVQTFRVTELTLNQSDLAAVGTFGMNANFYMLLNARNDQVRVDSVYPDGSVLQQGTNTFSFVADSPTYGIQTSNIQVVLNGVNISSNLSFTGSSTSWNVSYSGLQPWKSYTAVITVTDNNHQVHTTTVNFDTFDPGAFTWEAEDWDFDPTLSPAPNGSPNRFIDNPAPTSVAQTNSYFAQIGDLGIDESPIIAGAHLGTYLYRASDYTATEITSDATRARYLNVQLAQTNGAIADYDIFDLTNGGWINWTRTFPPGSYNIYGRLSAGNGAFNLQCAQVTGGAGTTNQTTSYLGTFKGTGASFTTWQWVPMVNTNTSQAVVVNLAGVNTLQMTPDGNENINFFMLVPAISSLQLSATLSAGNILLTFPTDFGATYSIYYKNHITDPVWTLLTSLTGDGTAKTVSDPVNPSSRFYRLAVQ